MTANSANTANTANTANSANAGISGDSGGGWFLPDRVDFPFISEKYDGTSPGDLKDLETGQGFQAFQNRDWAAKWNAWRLLFEFMTTAGGISTNAITAVETVWTNDVILPTQLAKELDDLNLAARDERAEALGEILSQDAEFITDFMSLLTITPGSHPATYRLLHGASLTALYAAQYFKGVHPLTMNRPRPSQIVPALMPPIPLPGHASFPSGHATQAYLMAFCIESMLAGKSYQLTIARNVKVLARRIARNREIAGLHYASDSKAGAALADELMATLNTLSSSSQFKVLVAAALGEWS